MARVKPDKTAAPHRHHRTPRIRRYLIAGVLTLIPIWVTWLVFRFVFLKMSELGAPWVRAAARTVEPHAPTMANWLVQPWFQSLLAVTVTLLGLYILGWAVTRVLGRRIVAAFDALMERIPLVQNIYGSTRKLLGALQRKPDGVQRVVLIDFPSEHMKTVGFVTRLLKDEHTGADLAAVYVPTTPNPTSGYLEIVPLENVISTDWTLDEAMTFIISGGAVAPEEVPYAMSHEDADAAKTSAD